ncbi:MAG: isocitrate lyase/phosphoenolpyruvate mutase family protein [Acetobacteraceae bacterium]|nr:isocitrate lyase/phosphoenolpyruvate mutase family protein [Acetobacteraceae bacterium]
MPASQAEKVQQFRALHAAPGSCRRSRRPVPTCLMAPGLPTLDAVRAVCAAVSRPVNFMAGPRGRSFTVAALAEAGVKRISLATSLYRAAMSGLLAAAREV